MAEGPRPLPGVVHVARDVDGTGGGEVVWQLAVASAEAGVRTTVITDRPPARPMPGVDVRLTSGGRRLGAWRPRGRLTTTLRHLLQIVLFSVQGTAAASRARRVGDVVFSHNIEALAADVLVMHNFYARELVEDLRRSPAKVRRLFNPVLAVRLVRELAAVLVVRPDAVVAVSAASASSLRTFSRRAGADLVVIPNGVDLERYQPAPAPQRRRVREELGVRPGEQLVFFVGHEFERKGLGVLLRAISGAELPPLRLVVVGGRPDERPGFESLAEQLGVAGHVSWLGTRSDVDRLLPSGDVFALPSSYETMPLVALEALACGVPVVLSPACPAADLITSPTVGEVRERTARAFADGLRSQLAGERPETPRQECRSAVSDQGWGTAAAAYSTVAVEVTRRLHSPLKRSATPAEEVDVPRRRSGRTDRGGRAQA